MERPESKTHTITHTPKRGAYKMVRVKQGRLIYDNVMRKCKKRESRFMEMDRKNAKEIVKKKNAKKKNAKNKKR